MIAPFRESGEKVMSFGEYRKGSNEYGNLVSKIMMWLRIHKEESSGIIKVDLDKFLNETNIELDKLKLFLQDNTTKLISFDISIENNLITFSNLNKTKSNRFVWENTKPDKVEIKTLNK